MILVLMPAAWASVRNEPRRDENVGFKCPKSTFALCGKASRVETPLMLVASPFDGGEEGDPYDFVDASFGLKLRGASCGAIEVVVASSSLRFVGEPLTGSLSSSSEGLPSRNRAPLSISAPKSAI